VILLITATLLGSFVIETIVAFGVTIDQSNRIKQDFLAGLVRDNPEAAEERISNLAPVEMSSDLYNMLGLAIEVQADKIHDRRSQMRRYEQALRAFESAEKSYRQESRNSDGDKLDQIVSNIATTRYRVCSFDEAIALLRWLFEKHPNESKVAFDLAVAFHRYGTFDAERNNAATNVSRRDPHPAAQGKESSAIDMYQTVIRKHGIDEAAAHFNLAALYITVAAKIDERGMRQTTSGTGDVEKYVLLAYDEAEESLKQGGEDWTGHVSKALKPKPNAEPYCLSRETPDPNDLSALLDDKYFRIFLNNQGRYSILKDLLPIKEKLASEARR
jgi:hypothetical protein